MHGTGDAAATLHAQEDLLAIYRWGNLSTLGYLCIKSPDGPTAPKLDLRRDEQPGFKARQRWVSAVSSAKQRCPSPFPARNQAAAFFSGWGPSQRAYMDLSDGLLAAGLLPSFKMFV